MCCGASAVDRDARALDALSSVDGVSVRQADLEEGPWPLDGLKFDGIVVANYLHRPLFPRTLLALSAVAEAYGKTLSNSRATPFVQRISCVTAREAPLDDVKTVARGGLRDLRHQREGIVMHGAGRRARSKIVR